MKNWHVSLLACAALAGISCGGGETPTPTSTSVLTTIVVSFTTPTVTVGLTSLASASGRDQNGAALSVSAVAWTSSAPAVATVNASGTVTGVSPGEALITASSAGKQGAATVVVLPSSGTSGRDFSIVDAQLTQGVQTADGSIPMVLDGNAAVVNVLVRSVPAITTPTQVVLRVFDAAGAVIRSDTAVASGSAAPTYDAPSVQFLLPASLLKTARRWQVVRDPKHLVNDDIESNDVFPRTGTSALVAVAVPPLSIRFIPIVLAAHGNVVGAITSATIPQYLRTLLSIHPLGVVSAHIGPTMTTNANFGTPPSGGAASFWQQVIAEIDLARTLDTVEPNANWFGVVMPPPGFSNTSYGGFSYIPSNGSAFGPGTRTSAAVQINWFTRPTQARDLVAHEIGHTFGRQHAPCGNATTPDPAYPIPGGTIEQAGHDVFAWANLLAGSAATIPTSTGDVMGYCFPVWSSAYTYKHALAFRGTSVVLAARTAEPMTRTLVVRGSITDGNRITIEPSFTVAARPALPDHPGAYTLEALGADGHVLFSHSFEPSMLDHAPNIRPFLFVVPITPDMETALTSIVVRGPAGIQRVVRPAGSSVALRDQLPVQGTRDANGLLDISCADLSSRGILVLNGGAVLGSATGASLRVAAERGAALTIICSDGVRSQSSVATVP
ncbi:MAG: hypothetical protein JWM95_2004 [Gemmatimonadetes bacterium]|nr:hypothetical protein [Gemmatimonadota bacterium]